MTTHRPLSLVFLLAFVACAHARHVDLVAQKPGMHAYYPYETAALLADPAPPRPVDLPQRVVAIAPTPADINRRGGVGAGVAVAVLAGLAALAVTSPGLFA